MGREGFRDCCCKRSRRTVGRFWGGRPGVVDLTAPLGPDAPLPGLPREPAVNTPTIEIQGISEYDGDGLARAWHRPEAGGRWGTGFDAPHRWVTGRDPAGGTLALVPQL